LSRDRRRSHRKSSECGVNERSQSQVHDCFAADRGLALLVRSYRDRDRFRDTGPFSNEGASLYLNHDIFRCIANTKNSYLNSTNTINPRG